MKFRLDIQHYIGDRLLEPGHIIGNETDVPFIDARGKPMIPSRNMTPLDDEAWDIFNKTFPGTQGRPERDPTKAIPLRGTGDTAKAPPLYAKDSDGRVVQPGGSGKTVDNVPGGYVEGKDHELKKGLPDSGSPNNPVGRPVIGQLPTTPRPMVPSKPVDPDIATNPAQAREAQAKVDADKVVAAKAAEVKK